MTDKTCSVCNVIVFGDFFTCKGFLCDRAAHYYCCGLKTTQLKSFKSAIACIKGISWFCEDCDSNTVALFTKLDDILAAVKKTDVPVVQKTPTHQHHDILAPIISTASTIVIDRPNTRSQSRQNLEVLATPTYTCTVATPTVNSQPFIQPGLQSKSVAENVITVKPPDNSKLEDQPLTQFQPESKANKINSELQNTTSSDILETITAVEPRRWIFISRIHRSVTDAQFKWFLDNKLQVTDANIKRMNPRSVNGNNCDHISYRISVPETSFVTLLNPNLWPAGLLIKEFEFRPYNSYFRNFGPRHQPK